MVKSLTDTQRRVLQYVMAHAEEHGVAPTVREISTMFGFRSTRGSTVHLDALERKGHIARTPRPHGIRVLLDGDGRHVRLRYVVEEQRAT